MKLYQITQEELERHVPATRNATDEVFNQLAGPMEQAEGTLLRMLGVLPPDMAEKEEVDAMAVRFICLEGFFRAIPQLDLILTGSGFGIVSTGNVAPASAHRVDALREEIRRQRSDTFEWLLEKLVGTPWAGQVHCREFVPGLLFTAMQLRRYGVRMENGADVYREEFYALAAPIREAEAFLTARYSPELYEALVQKLLEGTCTPLESVAIERMRKVMACHIQKKYPRSLHLMTDELARFVEEHADDLPAYKDTRTYAANHFEPYRNQANDNTFFFS